MTDLSSIQKTISPIAEQYGVDRVYLFGSRARGDARSDSDYDFMISKGKVHSLWQMVALWEDMEAALNAPVDVITDTSTDHLLIDTAKKKED